MTEAQFANTKDRPWPADRQAPVKQSVSHDAQQFMPLPVGRSSGILHHQLVSRQNACLLSCARISLSFGVRKRRPSVIWGRGLDVKATVARTSGTPLEILPSKKSCQTAARRACVRQGADRVTNFAEICTTTMVDIFVVGYTQFRNRFGGCLQWTVAGKHCTNSKTGK